MQVRPPHNSDEAREAERQFELSQNATLQRNKAQATLDRNDNLQRELIEYIEKLRLAMPDRDVSTNLRQRYELAYKNMRRALRQVVLASGKSYAVPKYFPAPAVPDDVEVVGPEAFLQTDDGPTVPSRSRRATGIQPTLPDGRPNEAWLNLQGVK